MTHTYHCWIVAGMPTEQKQLIHASQIAVHKTLFAPGSPLSFCSITDRESRAEWDCACAQNLNTCSFIPYGKLMSCVCFESRNGRLKQLQSFWYTLYMETAFSERMFNSCSLFIAFIWDMRKLIISMFLYSLCFHHSTLRFMDALWLIVMN